MSTVLQERLDANTVHERRRALRALLARPFLHARGPDADTFVLVRRHAAWLRAWFARETGWSLHVDTGLARLRKTPAVHDDATRGARARPGDPAFSRRRYVLLCLALAVLETQDRQTALGRLAEFILASVAADPDLAAAGIRFALDNRDERRDLVAVVRVLIGLGVMRPVDGDEQAYVAGSGDALYTIDRSALSALLATRRPVSTVDAPTLDERLAAITTEVVPDTAEARNRARRHSLARRLLDDPVLYLDDLDEDERAYLTGQRGRILTALTEATGLHAEVRAEGIALVDDRGDLSDVGMPEEGTDGHLTLLVAEHLAAAARERPDEAVPRAELEALTARLVAEHQAHWRRDVTEPGAEVHLAAAAVERLAALRLVRVTDAGVVPRPAIARYALAEPRRPPDLLSELP